MKSFPGSWSETAAPQTLPAAPRCCQTDRKGLRGVELCSGEYSEKRLNSFNGNLKIKIKEEREEVALLRAARRGAPVFVAVWSRANSCSQKAPERERFLVGGRTRTGVSHGNVLL